MTFKIGDRIVYPMHGAGYIEDIEKQIIGGVLREYYCICVLGNNIRLKLPVVNGGSIRLRSVMEKEQAEAVLKHFETHVVDMSQPWGKRYKENMDRLKTGDPLEIAEVVKTLMMREKNVGLSIGDRQLLINAKNVFVGELSLALERDVEVLRQELAQMI